MDFVNSSKLQKVWKHSKIEEQVKKQKAIKKSREQLQKVRSKPEAS